MRARTGNSISVRKQNNTTTKPMVMKQNDIMWMMLIILSVSLNVVNFYINYRMNKRWNRMYEMLNEKHHPVIEQHGSSVIFTIKNQ